MAKKRPSRIPKKGDLVGTARQHGVFVVVAVHSGPKTVDLKLLSGFGPAESGIPWTALVSLDEEDASQAAEDRQIGY
jgi:hypothetical protein